MEERQSALGYVTDTVQSVARSVREGLTAQTAYGEPVTADGVTVIPVAKITFGFGAGGGGGTGTQPAKPGESIAEGGEAATVGEGGGGGGGGAGAVQPLGYIEISQGGSRWVPLEPSRGEMLLRALTAAAVLAPVGGRRGFLQRLFLVLAGQAAVGALFRPRLPPIPAAVRARRAAVEAE